MYYTSGRLNAFGHSEDVSHSSDKGFSDLLKLRRERTARRWTPLMEAAHLGKLDVVELLVTREAKVGVA